MISYALQCAGDEGTFVLRLALRLAERAALTSHHGEVAPRAAAGTLSDEALMLQYRAGDPQAFHALYRRYQSKLFRYVLRTLAGRRSEAEEVFQEVWLAVIRGRRRYAQSATFASYLFGIAHRRAADHWRRHYRRLPKLATEDYAIIEGSEVALLTDGTQSALSNAQLGAALLAAVGALPEPQRTAFLLRCEAGLSVAEVAQITGVVEETVKSRMRYALHKLRSALESWQ